MMKKRGPGEGLTRHPGPGEGRKAGGGPLEVDVEGHALGDILTRPIDSVTGQPKTGHDGIVNRPRTGGEGVPEPDGRRH